MAGIRVVTAAVLAVVAAAGIVAGHQRPSASAIGTYKALLTDYRTGVDSSVERLIALDHQVLPATIAALRADEPAFLREHVRVVAMLHADAALVLVERRPSGDWWFHLDLASRLLERAGPDARPFAERWYAAVGRYLRERGWELAERFYEAGRRRLPGDPIVLYESAHLQEAVAADGPVLARYLAGAASRVTGTTYPTHVAEAAGKRRLARLNAAAGWLGEALKADPSHVMAKLHLGRVQMLRGEEDEALAILTGVSAIADDPAATYLAAMFAGATCERKGRLDDAAASYRTAHRHWPTGYAARVALSHVLGVAGKGDEARDTLDALFNQPADQRTDPWLWYLADPPGLAAERLEALRRTVRE